MERTDNVLPVVTSRGKTFNVRLVSDGDNYGQQRTSVYHGEPLVEWYESEYEGFDVLGRLVTRQSVKALLGARDNLALLGMRLAGEGHIFLIDPETITKVMDWISEGGSYGGS